MPSICFLTTSLHPIGGAEMQVANLAKALQGRGWTMTVVSMLPEGDELAEELRRCGVNVVTLDMQKGKARPAAIWKLAKILRTLKPEVLHAHMVEANLLARMTRLFVRVPVLVSSAHSIQEGGRLYDLAYRFTDGLGDVTTNVSAAATARYARDGLAPQQRLRVMYNGIDTNGFQPNEASRREMRRTLGIADEFVWLAIGNLRKPKDYPNMLRAFAGLRRTRLLIAGQGELRPQLEQLADELGLAGRVRFCGFCRNTEQLLNAADGYVLSSVFEGLPLVLLEAAATGLPIVATDVGGNAEIVLDGKTGFLVPASDSISLQNAMQTVMADPEPKQRRMGLAGRRFVAERFDMSPVVDAWESLYCEFLAKRNMSTPRPAAKLSTMDQVSGD